MKRVGCYAGDADGAWDAKSQNALEQFVRVSKADVPVGRVSLAALRAVGAQKEHICPLLCAAGEREIDGKCVGKIERARGRPGVAARSTTNGRLVGRRSALPNDRPHERAVHYRPGSKGGWVGEALRSTHKD